MRRLVRRPLRTIALAACAAVAAGTLTATSAAAVPAARKSVKGLLNSLTVAAEPADQSWGDFGQLKKSTKAGCRTVREEVLANDADGSFPAKCRITSSTWTDPYSGKKIGYRDVTFDRLVSLQEAWQSGASRWDDRTRLAFLNDLGYDGTLLAVSKKAAQKRNEREPSTWLPSTKAVRCTYAATWVSVKYRWALTVDAVEKTALTKTLQACGWPKVAVPAKAKVALTPVATPAPTPTPSPAPSTDPRKDTCAELKTAGLGPYVRDTDVEYAWYRDDDGDGIACESPEAVTMFPSNDWQTERYTRSATPKISAAVTKQADPGGSVNKRGILHARVLSGETEVWRGAQDSSVVVDGYVQELYVDPALADGGYTAQVWSSYSYDVNEAPPSSATTLSFVVDTQGPAAPTYTGSALGGTAVSDAADVARIRFTYADYPTEKAARPGQPVEWTAPMYSGPAFELRVQAIDRAGNTSSAVVR